MAVPLAETVCALCSLPMHAAVPRRVSCCIGEMRRCAVSISAQPALLWASHLLLPEPLPTGESWMGQERLSYQTVVRHLSPVGIQGLEV